MTPKNGNGRSVVLDAIGTARRQFRSQLEAHRVSLEESRLDRQFDTWILPAHCEAIQAIVKSYQLHRLLEDVQKAIEGQSGQDVNIVLES